MRDLVLPDGRRIPARMLAAQFSGGGGPGGQHVNKVATRAELRLDLQQAAAVLREDEMARVRTRLANRIAADDTLRIVRSVHRSQARNLEDALDGLESLLAAAIARPRKRVATKPTRGSQQRRRAAKQRRGDVKRMRRRPEAGE
jgi:ribosome-associated protein